MRVWELVDWVGAGMERVVGVRVGGKAGQGIGSVISLLNIWPP